MFSVGASPFNSRARQLYGGLVGGDALGDVYGGDALSDVYGGIARNYQGDLTDSTAMKNYYTENPAKYAEDAKWAALASRFSAERADRLAAKAIRSVMKREVVKAMKQNEDWKKNYLLSRAGMRSKYFRPRLTPRAKASIWNTVKRIPWNTARTTERERLFLNMLTRAPYTSKPDAPIMPDASLLGITSGAYTDQLPSNVYDYDPESVVNFLA